MMKVTFCEKVEKSSHLACRIYHLLQYELHNILLLITNLYVYLFLWFLLLSFLFKFPHLLYPSHYILCYQLTSFIFETFSIQSNHKLDNITQKLFKDILKIMKNMYKRTFISKTFKPHLLLAMQDFVLNASF